MTASKSLPARPSLESLRKQAKRLARDIAAGDAGAIARARMQLPDVDLPLTQRNAQLVIAREYGYAGWQDLTAEVSTRLGHGLKWAAAQARRVIHDNRERTRSSRERRGGAIVCTRRLCRGVRARLRAVTGRRRCGAVVAARARAARPVWLRLFLGRRPGLHRRPKLRQPAVAIARRLARRKARVRFLRIVRLALGARVVPHRDLAVRISAPVFPGLVRACADRDDRRRR